MIIATTLWQKIKHYLQNLNFFSSKPSSTDENELRTQRISTRLFIIIFFASLVVLLLYNLLITDTKIMKIETPSFAQYTHLNLTYSHTLKCPCSKISINYRKFLQIEYTLHQVCMSTFINQAWIDYLNNPTVKNLSPLDFRWTSQHAFQALRAFCDLINQTINDSLAQFYSNQYISASVIPQKLFEPETKLLIDGFRSSLTNSFSLSLAMIRETTQGNALISGRRTNYILSFTEDGIYILTVGYDSTCSCSYSSMCSYRSYIYHIVNSTRLFYVPGFYSGCYIIESLLQSSLECFYDQQCIDTLRRYLMSSSSVNVIPLDASFSRYSENSTVKELVENLMIEEWWTRTIFENYYNECQPIQCTYTLETNHEVVYIFTTLFGIAGGLVTILELVVPRLVSVIMYFIRKHRARVTPVRSFVDT